MKQDQKLIKFVNQALDYLENQYTGFNIEQQFIAWCQGSRRDQALSSIARRCQVNHLDTEYIGENWDKISEEL